MAYLTPADMLSADLGSRADKIPPEDLAVICDLASDGIDAYVGFSLDFRWHGGLDPRYPAEQHPWEGTLTLDLTHAPIRQVQSIMLANTFVNGVLDGPTWDSTAVVVNGQYGELQASSLTFRLGYGLIAAYLGFGDITPFWQVVYTSGYDAGDLGNVYALPKPTPTVVAPDGVCLPYPSWLKTAARFEVARLIGEYFRNRLGLTGGITSTSGGGFAYSVRPAMRTKEENPLDPNARQILDDHLDAQVMLGVV